MYSLAVLTTVLTAALGATIPKQPVSYDGYKVFRVSAGKNPEKITSIVEKLGLDAWSFPKTPNSKADLVVPPAKLSEFEKLISGFTSEVMHEDLGKSISKEGTFAAYAAGSANDTWFESYHSLDDHIQFLNDIQAAHPDNSEVVTAGNSFEDRPITGIHIWGDGGKGEKPGVVFHGTIHAREWITTMVTEYIIWQLFEDEEAKTFLNELDFYIFPVANPDGFEYTQTDRMWRKSREPSSDGSCVGTDLNRNYPMGWDGDGSSPDPCDETYRGPEAGSSSEIQAHTGFMKKVADGSGLKLFIDWHSYSQLFMSPYGYDCNKLPPNDSVLQSLAGTFAQALQAVHGTAFQTGPICSTIYQTNGNSADWALDEAGSEAAFAAELRDTGRNGFVLPPEEIKPSGEESWAGLKALLKELLG